MLRKFIVFAALGVATAVALVGCSKPAPAPTEKADPGKRDDHDHDHPPGTRGGVVVALGRDSYHVEAVFAKGGVIRLYTLGKNQAKVQEVDVQEFVGYVTPVGSTDAAEEVKFTAQPQPGDAAGKTSLFVAQLPPALQGKTVQVTINNIRVGSDRFRAAFTNESVKHEDGPMPSGAAGEKARKLHLTPGGKYTEADIQANGNTVPGVKYKGIKSDHNAKPKPGDKLCPVSMTKANPKFTWVVGGKTYEFCCPPCIDEFVELAKDRPDEVLDPSEYVKK